ncbi:aminomethyl-transferring glycine dehydrogenase subunit GcvPB [Microaceticoccus formicicus]|uniref:aminomethyl-transferring glycine dehydrogenase subunit GcvPB n=1 Tax=Microaceticoccus formicicus TaxID=3118105 RepID=UPI003CD01CBC|nr:aminomethyl-transferring glycine dehydrogenase subunit GcvPB [Peptoniphilaceae bacterium AMB_02]
MKAINREGLVRDVHQARWNEPIIFELHQPGERGILVPKCEKAIEDIVGNGVDSIPKSLRRKKLPKLPEINQKRVLMHYLRLSQEVLGGNLNPEIGQGTCTVKYNPIVNDDLANRDKVKFLHPEQPVETLQGILKIMHESDLMMQEISGMDKFSFQPGGGSQATMAMASIVRMYHRVRGEEEKRDEMITTLYSHPSDAAAPALKGYKIIYIPADESGHPDYEAFKNAVSERTAGLIVANPEDTGIYNPRIKEFTDIIHENGGLCLYDQANANGLFGIARAKEAGFDICYFNMHKSFGTPHGCGGPGSGAIGVVKELIEYLPVPLIDKRNDEYFLNYNLKNTIGRVKMFLGTPQVMVKAYAWMMSLGADGLYEVGKVAALNNLYLMKKVLEHKAISNPYPDNIQRIEQNRYTIEKMKNETGIGFGEVSNRMMDFCKHIWSSHHPQYIPEPITLEPTETPSKQDLDEYVATLHQIFDEAYENPQVIIDAPTKSTIHRVDESSLDDPENWCPTWRVYLEKIGK